MHIGRHVTHANEIWKSRIGGRKFRNPAPDRLSSSEAEIGDFAEHAGDWCENGPDATLITSLVDAPHLPDGSPFVLHMPVLDLDVEHLYYPSTTPGHGALLLNVCLTKDEHEELLALLERLGIIQPGFAEASRQRGYAALRTPWTDKVEHVDHTIDYVPLDYEEEV